VNGDRMPGARWYPEARLNFAENLLRRRDASNGDGFLGRRQGKAAPHASRSCTNRSRKSLRNCAHWASNPATEWPLICPTCPKAISGDACRDEHRRDLLDVFP